MMIVIAREKIDVPVKEPISTRREDQLDEALERHGRHVVVRQGQLEKVPIQDQRRFARPAGLGQDSLQALHEMNEDRTRLGWIGVGTSRREVT